MHNNKNPKFSDQAVSEVIGGVLLISVVVMAVAIVGVMLTSQGTPQKIPALDAVISNYGRTIQIYHNGGDSLQKNEMAVLLDGVETAFLKGADPSWTIWTAGESLVYNVPGSGDMPKVVRIIFKGGGGSTVLATADFSATGMINPGPPSPGTLKVDFSGTPLSGNPPLVVQFSDSSAGSPISWAWAFGDGGTSSQQNPAHIYLNKGTYSVSLTVMNTSGSYNALNRPNYIAVNAPGPVANFVGNPRAGPVPLTVYFVDTSTGSPTSWLWEFGDGSTSTVQNPSYQYKYTGSYTVNLTATNAGGSNKISQVNYVSTTLSGPAVTAITPNVSVQTTPVLVTIAGNGFQTGANVTLVKSGSPDIIATSVNVVSGNLITCQFNLATATPGLWDVKVTNTDGQSSTLAAAFTVKNPAPAVTSITPNTGARGWAVSITNLAGNNFRSGAVVKLVNVSAGPDITAASVVVVSATQITCTFDLSGAAAARYNVTVTNPYSDTGTLVNGFTVTSNAPTVTSSTPATGAQAATVSITNLAGTGFQPGATVSYSQGAYSIPLTGVNVVSATSITGTLVIPSLAPAGAYNITVTNTDGKSATRTAGFTVTSNAPTVTSITPNTAVRGWTVSITNLAGSNFQNGATVRLVNASAGPDITAANVVVVSATQITCTFDLTGAPAARRIVTVTNPDGKTGTLANGFTVTGAAPTLTVRNPTTGNRGWPVTIISLTGTGFQPGAGVRLQRSGYSDVIATGVNVASPTSINAGTFNLLGVTAGAWTIRVINADGGSSGTLAFTVNSPAPTITGITPNTAARGTTVSITNLAGTNFQPSATIQLRNATTVISTGTSVNVVSPTLITCQFTIPTGSVRPGTNVYYIRVTNTDAGAGNSGNIFSIT